MAHFEASGFAPFGDRIVPLPGGYVPDDNETVVCAYCGKDLPLIEDTDEDGRPVAHFGNPEHTSLRDGQCCSLGCAALLDLDVCDGLKTLVKYLQGLGSCLPTMAVGFRRTPPAAYAQELLLRHEYALNDLGLSEIVKENA